MIKCPKCNAAFNTFRFSGWVVNAAGAVTIGEDGEITAVGSLVTRCSVKPGHEIEHPMAIVILGGLISSTALNLFLMPALYARYGEDRAVSPPTALREVLA